MLLPVPFKLVLFCSIKAQSVSPVPKKSLHVKISEALLPDALVTPPGN